MTDLKRCAYFDTSLLSDSGTDGVYHARGVMLYDLVGITTVKDLTSNWVVYLPAVSLSGIQVPGSFLRFSVSNIVTRLDSTFRTVADFDVSWDEATAYANRELDPSLSSVALICESSRNKKIGYNPSIVPETAFGITLPNGSTLASRNSDIDKIIDSFGTGNGDTSFDGSRLVKRSGIPQVIPGGTTVTEFLNNYFYPFVPASVSLNPLQTYQYGTSNSFSLVGNVEPNDETQIYARRVYDVTSGTVLLGTVDSNSFSYPLTNVVASHSYRVDVDVGNNGSPVTLSSPTRSVTFVYPFIYGMSQDASPTGSSLYSSLTKNVSSKSSKTVVLSGSDKFIYFAYPLSYGALSSIYDQNGFDVTGSFESYQLSVVSSNLNYNNWTQAYYVYKTTSVTSVDSKPFVFNF